MHPLISNKEDRNMKCPSCSSENTQLIRMVCMNGTTTGRSQAAGIDNRLDYGFATIESQSQTELARSLTPGPRPGVGGPAIVVTGIVLLGLGCLMFGSSAGCLAPVVLGTGGIILLFGIATTCSGSEKAVAEWEKKKREYESGWICHRCGCKWIPGQAAVRPSRQS